jgi:hypothetical protein
LLLCTGTSDESIDRAWPPAPSTTLTSLLYWRQS